jgi:hypothetical protein
MVPEGRRDREPQTREVCKSPRVSSAAARSPHYTNTVFSKQLLHVVEPAELIPLLRLQRRSRVGAMCEAVQPPPGPPSASPRRRASGIRTIRGVGGFPDRFLTRRGRGHAGFRHMGGIARRMSLTVVTMVVTGSQVTFHGCFCAFCLCAWRDCLSFTPEIGLHEFLSLLSPDTSTSM